MATDTWAVAVDAQEATSKSVRLCELLHHSDSANREAEPAARPNPGLVRAPNEGAPLRIILTLQLRLRIILTLKLWFRNILILTR